MNKIYLLLGAALLSYGINAQTNAIPNGNFESWTTINHDELTGYSSSNLQSIIKYNTAANCTKVADPFHGTYAIKLQTTLGSAGDTAMGYLAATPNPNGNNPCVWQGGIPYNQMPTGIKGYYKSNIASPDSACILVAFRSGGSCLVKLVERLFHIARVLAKGPADTDRL